MKVRCTDSILLMSITIPAEQYFTAVVFYLNILFLQLTLLSMIPIIDKNRPSYTLQINHTLLYCGLTVEGSYSFGFKKNEEC